MLLAANGLPLPRRGERPQNASVCVQYIPFCFYSIAVHSIVGVMYTGRSLVVYLVELFCLRFMLFTYGLLYLVKPLFYWLMRESLIIIYCVLFIIIIFYVL